VDGGALLDDLTAVVKRFVVLPQWGAETVALWTLHTYCFQLRDVSTYLGLESPQHRCGKTTLLKVLNRLVNRPVVSSNISHPAFYRAIEEMRPTLMIDEGDTVLSGNDELRGILNAGYTRDTAFVVRVANQGEDYDELADDKEQKPKGKGAKRRKPGRGSRLVSFSSWCPKVIATIGHLPATLADRCIVIHMERRLPSEKCERLRNFDGTVYRRECARFVRDNARAIAGAEPALPESLNDRAADVWEPLLALADLAGGEWPARAREAARALSGGGQENSPIGLLLLDILKGFVSLAGNRVSARSLVRWLRELTDRPWGDGLKGRPLTEHWLALQLRPYGIRPRTMRMGEAVLRGYFVDDFMDAFRRYVPRAELERMQSGGMEEE
jgi:hypothetical protein